MDISIIDNFFLESDIFKIKQYFTQTQPAWKCQCLNKSNTDLTNDIPFWRKDLNDENLFFVELKNIIMHKLQHKCTLLRVYAVSQTYSQNGNYHIDDASEDTYTFVVYINEQYDESTDGYFYIKTPQQSILAIEPIFNRGVLFPANHRHKGCGYNKSNSNLRICVAWKLQLILD
jgi:hypothetical protein